MYASPPSPAASSPSLLVRRPSTPRVYYNRPAIAWYHEAVVVTATGPRCLHPPNAHPSTAAWSIPVFCGASTPRRTPALGAAAEAAEAATATATAAAAALTTPPEPTPS